MAGKIIADILEHSTAGSVTTDYVVNGSAKVWVNFNGTGTIAARDSFNQSSLTDNAVGDFTVGGFTNNMDNANYTLTTATISDLSADRCVFGLTNDQIITTSSLRVGTIDAGNNAMRDQEYNFLALHGDLA